MSRHSIPNNCHGDKGIHSLINLLTIFALLLDVVGMCKYLILDGSVGKQTELAFYSDSVTI